MNDIKETYLRFVENRHRVWEKRQVGLLQPWTDDPILATKKFTNVYRVLDHGSQFLVKELLYGESDIEFGDALMRCFLYRYTNIPEPWEHFHRETGNYPRMHDLQTQMLPKIWHEYKAAGNPLFGVAYKIFVGQENRGTDRLSWILNLTDQYFNPDSDHYIVPAFENRWSMRKRIQLLRTIPRCAAFMSMQIVTDIGYSSWGKVMDADENEFVVAGPGAQAGAAHLFPEQDPYDTIKWARRTLISRRGCPRLDGRYPSLMDVQNTLCEFSKYVRYMGKPIPARPFVPKHPGPQPKPLLPAHW